MALTELSRYVPRSELHRNRYLRSGMRPRDGQAEAMPTAPRPNAMLRNHGLFQSAGLELPPGASFDPDPQSGANHR